MLTMKEQLNFVFQGAKTKRYHTTDTLTSQTVGEHSFGVAMFCLILTAGKCSNALVYAALTHDLAEHKVGDIASPVKRKIPELKEIVDDYEEDCLRLAGFEVNLPAEETRILKLADYMDGCMFCIREARYGHNAIKEVYGNFLSYILELDPEVGPERLVLATIIRLWEEANEK